MSMEPDLRAAQLAIRSRALGRLLFSRHLRIWPVVAVVILGYLVLAHLDGGELTAQIFRTWPLYLTYLGNVPKYLYEGRAFPSHFWLVSAQEQVILLVGIAIIVLGYERFSGLLFPMLLLGVVSRSVGAALFMPGHTAIALDTPFSVMDSLAVGFLLQAALANRADRTAVRRQLGGIGLTALAVWATLPNTPSVYFGLAPFIGAIWGAFFLVSMTDPLRAPGLAQSFIGSRFLVHCGKIALSLFLIHPLVNAVLLLSYAIAFGNTIPWSWFTIVGPVAAFAIANGLYLAIEAPMQSIRSTIKAAALAESCT
jgi:peptidoglycan/LPS O-acetylase OafA/YrhL